MLQPMRCTNHISCNLLAGQTERGRKHADSIDFNCVCDYRRSIYPGYGHRNPGRAGMEDLPEGKVSDPVDEIDGMNCVWRKELAE